MKNTMLVVMICFMLFTPNASASERLFMVNDVEIISQFPQLPSGCEATSTTMLLNYFGVPATKTDVADLLPKGNMPRVVKSSYIGGNPNTVFVGNPYSTIGYGVFEQPILDIIEHYIPGKSKNLTGSSFNDLLHTIQEGAPVVVWATLNMKDPKQLDEWVDDEGNMVYWNGPEHVLLMVGWDDDNAYFNDPYTGKRVTYNLWTFKDRWEKMGSRAVTVEHQEDEKGDTENPSTQPDTITSITYGLYDYQIGVGSSIPVPEITVNYERGLQSEVTSSVQFSSASSHVSIHDHYLTGVSIGNAQIEATFGGKTVTFSLKVAETPDKSQGIPMKPLRDIGKHWAHDAILRGRELQIVEGYQDGTFRPDSKVTEAEFLAMLFRMYPDNVSVLQLEVPNGGSWSDVYYSYANMFKLGLDGNSRNIEIKRVEVAQIISGLSGKNFSNNDDAVKFLLDNRFSQGKTSATISGFAGNDGLTRAEALQFLQNLQDKGMTLLQARPNLITN
ncbi:hypothetical protein GK047_18695 [Paenibacillus sp. SYP-B3998]|uniref:SLH domain-containing protein n=1 Tax=Paenibacillus sp. SYP-B3998 TaxID=2678564 RepID=A0A6G4A0W5_9BACL|nr:C39 family peptidase [Paenibacillus sp. SYP-B3998]NEW08032.1 hypothetical protein [Paenibacillus sp. SYP-B3998]